MAGKTVLLGGEKLRIKLAEMANKIRGQGVLRVGFLEGFNYPDGTPVAYVAAINEFGATVEVASHHQTIYRKITRDGRWSDNAKFQKASAENVVATDHEVAAHSITIPSRPFFRTMIAENANGWGSILAAQIAGGTSVDGAMQELGKIMIDQLQSSIRAMQDPPNAKSTVRKKGFNNPLIDTGMMLKSVSSEVRSEGDEQ